MPLVPFARNVLTEHLQAPLASYGKRPHPPKEESRAIDGFPHSSAKDQLTGQAVAVKKIMKPFSTPVLSKRTYRELKLLKHLKHENVRPSEKAWMRWRKGRH